MAASLKLMKTDGTDSQAPSPEPVGSMGPDVDVVTEIPDPTVIPIDEMDRLNLGIGGFRCRPNREDPDPTTTDR